MAPSSLAPSLSVRLRLSLGSSDSDLSKISGHWPEIRGCATAPPTYPASVPPASWPGSPSPGAFRRPRAPSTLTHGGPRPVPAGLLRPQQPTYPACVAGKGRPPTLTFCHHLAPVMRDPPSRTGYRSFVLGPYSGPKASRPLPRSSPPPPSRLATRGAFMAPLVSVRSGADLPSRRGSQMGPETHLLPQISVFTETGHI